MTSKSRSADYTIKGFLYQFNKSIFEILNAEEGAIVKIEGVIEDVEIVTQSLITGIQCKYHEASKSYTPSTIYKPLLQMLCHFASNPNKNIEYILFAHFPNIGECPPSVGKTELEAALASTDKSLKNLIKEVPETIDIDGFIKKFKMEFGPSYNELVKQVSKELEDNGIPNGEIETLAYPNAVHIIAGLSILHDSTKRQITKKQFLDKLSSIRTTTISRWTMALNTRNKLLEARRKQLKYHLDKNTRLRYFVIDPISFDDYDSEIILFISDYLDKYHYKPAHISTPLICICASREEVQEIQHRLYKKGIITTDGYVGSKFEESFFFRYPFSAKGTEGNIQREFTLRVTNWIDHQDILNSKKCDDLFVIGEPDCSSLDTKDINVECLYGTNFKEIKYVMGVSNVYE